MTATSLDFSYHHLPAFDDPPPVPTPAPSRWQRWKGTVLSAIGAAGSIGLRVANLSPIANGISSFTAGFSIQSLFESSFSNLPRIRQISLTAFGQTSFFALTQAFANTSGDLENESAARTRVILTQMVIGLFGANTETLFRWFWAEGGLLRAESLPLPSQTGSKFLQTDVLSFLLSRIPRLRRSIERYHKYTQVFIRILKYSATPAALLGRIGMKDPILKGLVSFMGGLYGAQAIGETVIDGLDEAIKKHDSPEFGTHFRTAKTAFITLWFLALPFCAIPWVNPETQERTDQLLYVGLVLGLFDGISTRSSMRRIEHMPIDAMEEFQPIASDPICKKVAHQITLYSLPVLGLFGFSIWQQVAELSDKDSQAALWSTFTGFSTSFTLGKLTDTIWNPKKRDRLQDWLMVSLWASPRFLGINPLHLYYAITNLLNLDGRDISRESPLHQAMIVIAWTCYGVAMGRELVITSSSRAGNLNLKFPHMVMMNGSIETYLYMKKLVGHLRYP